MKLLIVVDMQNDFIDGALGTAEALAVTPRVAELMRGFAGEIICTRDTHNERYPETQEGRLLPVAHCVRGTRGWELNPQIAALATGAIIDKPDSFGSVELGRRLAGKNAAEAIEEITLCGLCTDICVIANALVLKAFLPNVPIYVDASCCAGVSPERHETALDAMSACQIHIINRK